MGGGRVQYEERKKRKREQKQKQKQAVQCTRNDMEYGMDIYTAEEEQRWLLLLFM